MDDENRCGDSIGEVIDVTTLVVAAAASRDNTVTGSIRTTNQFCHMLDSLPASNRPPHYQDGDDKKVTGVCKI